MEKVDYINAFLLNKYAFTIFLLMVILALSTIPGAPSTNPLPQPW